MTHETLHIEGMTCNHCVMSVRKALAQIEGLEVEDVRIGAADVARDEGRVDRETLARAIGAAGFRLA